ncbi:MAG: hypothetical protein WA143_07675 [Lutibacter sp.]
MRIAYFGEVLDFTGFLTANFAKKIRKGRKKIRYSLLIQPALRIEAESLTRQLAGNAHQKGGQAPNNIFKFGLYYNFRSTLPT